MTDEELTQAMAELQEVVRCRCDEAYRDRGLKDPHCECDSADAVKVVADRIKALTEQLTAARADAKEAEAYAEELEKELRTTRMAQAVMDNTVADLEAKLAKAVEALQWCAMYGDGDVALATIAEIKGESHD
jgi:chromosome segregation ATPase